MSGAGFIVNTYSVYSMGVGSANKISFFGWQQAIVAPFGLECQLTRNILVAQYKNADFFPMSIRKPCLNGRKKQAHYTRAHLNIAMAEC